MGTYSEFVFSCKLKEEIPENVQNILKYLVGETEEDKELEDYPDHPFFRSERWRFLLIASYEATRPKNLNQFYFDPIFNTYFLTVHSTIKNYDQEIEKFLHWIAPYCDMPYQEPTLVGYKHTIEFTAGLELIYLSEGKAYLTQVPSLPIKEIERKDLREDKQNEVFYKWLDPDFYEDEIDENGNLLPKSGWTSSEEAKCVICHRSTRNGFTSRGEDFPLCVKCEQKFYERKNRGFGDKQLPY